MANTPEILVAIKSDGDLEMSVLDYGVIKSIEYHWLTKKIKKIVYRDADEIIALLSHREENK